MPASSAPRFLTLADVAEVLNVSASQAYALVRSGELRGIKVGGRGQWRVESAELERYIARAYDDTSRYVREHPFTDAALTAGDAPDARAGLRVRVSWPGRLRLADGRVIDVQVRNLSEGGVGLASAGRIPADTVVDFDMSVPPLEEGGDATLVKGAIKTTYTVVRGAELLCGGTWQAPPARVDLVRSWIRRLRR